MLFYFILFNAGLICLNVLWRDGGRGAGQALQQLVILGLASLAEFYGSEGGLYLALGLLILSTLGAGQFQRRLHLAVRGQDVRRARALNRWTRLMFWGTPGLQLQAQVEESCRRLEGGEPLEADDPPNRLVIRSNARDWQAALDAFCEWESSSRSALPCWAYLIGARSAARLGRFEDAANILERSLQADYAPPGELLRMSAAMVFCASGAAEPMERWMASLPESQWSDSIRWHARGLCMARAGDQEGAGQAWQRALEGADDTLRSHVEADIARVSELPVTVSVTLLTRMEQVYSKLQRGALLSEAGLGNCTRLLLGLLALSFVLQPASLRDSAYLAWGKLDLWRLFGHMFTHINLAHVLINWLALSSLAGWVEAVFGWRMLWIYLPAGMLSGIAQLALVPNAYLVGASGAVMGILGARAAILWLWAPMGRPFRRRHSKAMLLLVALQIVADQLIPHVGGVAHLSGLLSGFVLAAVMLRYRVK